MVIKLKNLNRKRENKWQHIIVKAWQGKGLVARSACHAQTHANLYPFFGPFTRRVGPRTGGPSLLVHLLVRRVGPTASLGPSTAALCRLHRHKSQQCHLLVCLPLTCSPFSFYVLFQKQLEKHISKRKKLLREKWNSYVIVIKHLLILILNTICVRSFTCIFYNLLYHHQFIKYIAQKFTIC